MKINFNIGAVLVNNSLNKNDNLLSNSLEKLSTGYRINSAKDDPAGLAISKRMRAQIDGLDAATNNANTGISVVEIAEGALTEVQNMVQRISELSVKAANGSITDDDRNAINDEVQQLKTEITRISEATEYNGKGLLDGTFEPKGFTDNLDVKVANYSDEVSKGEYEIEITQAGEVDENGVIVQNVEATLGDGFPDGAVLTTEGNRITVKAPNGFEVNLNVGEAIVPPSNVTIDVTGIGGMRTQIGANEGQILDIKIPRVSLEEMSIEFLDLSTEESSLAAMDSITVAHDFILDIRSKLGAYQNRLEHTISSLDVTGENLTASYSRIMDVDMAKEMTEFTKLQVMTQAGTSMLAQSNQRPQQVLQLLQ